MLLILLLCMTGEKQRVTSTKLYETTHVRYIFEMGYSSQVAELAADVESFLAELEQRWSIVLPDEKINVTLGTRERVLGSATHLPGSPKWLSAMYEPAERRIRIAVRSLNHYEHGPVLRETRHLIIRALLSLKPKNRLPTLLEVGMANYYAGPGQMRNRFTLILALRRQDDLWAWAQSLTDESDQTERIYAAAVGDAFVRWLWETYPDSETIFLQNFLRGKKPERAFAQAVLPEYEKAFEAFQQVVRTQNKPWHIIKTIDFWVIIVGSIILLLMLRAVINAFRATRMEEVKIEQIEPTLDPVLLKGPIFGEPEAPATDPLFDMPSIPDIEATPEPGPARKPPRKIHDPLSRPATVGPSAPPPGQNPFEDVDDHLDGVFDQLGSGEETVGVEDVITNDAPSPKDGDPFDTIDGELDDVFDNLAHLQTEQKKPEPTPQQAGRPAPTSKDGAQLDEEVDRIFGDWDGL